ncbi:MAG: hypothetical protein ACRD2D_10930 [Terriglobales bacterium]
MNYFNYFTEIEEHFQRKRGAQIYLSPVDWDLIHGWREAGVPLAEVLAGIDQAFEKFEQGRRRDAQKPRALVYCAAAVLDAAEARRQAAVGAPTAPATAADDHFKRERIADFLAGAEAKLAASPALPPAVAGEIAEELARLSAALASDVGLVLPELDRRLSALDDKLYSALLLATPVADLSRLKAELESDLAPYRRTLRPEQMAMIERQFTQRRLLERAGLPRLSLFFLPV